MRKLLMLSLLALLTASATGCISSNPCGGGWHPGSMLFGNRHDCCCEHTMSAPAYTQGGCCQ
jgi:hypothetical protein